MGQRIIAIANQKGGTAKTTTTANLGYLFAKEGRKVLLIDIDPQGNLSEVFGLDLNSLHGTVGDLLHGRCELKDIAYKVGDNIDLIASNQSLVDDEIYLTSAVGREFRLKKALKDAEEYDYIIIDCPPSPGFLTVNAFTAANEVIIPVEPEMFGTSGLGAIERSIETVASEINPDLKICGVVVTKKVEQNLHNDLVETIREAYGDRCFKAVIPKNVSIAEAQAIRVPVGEYKPDSKGAIAYAALAKEVMAQEKA